MNKTQLGRIGESIAENWLNSQQYQIIKKNYYTRHGEIDIIATRNNTLIFFEIKTRTTQTFGTPQESITRKKREHLIKTALHFLHTSTQKNFKSWRIDLISVQLNHGKPPQIDHIKNIIDGN